MGSTATCTEPRRVLPPEFSLMHSVLLSPAPHLLSVCFFLLHTESGVILSNCIQLHCYSAHISSSGINSAKDWLTLSVQSIVVEKVCPQEQESHCKHREQRDQSYCSARFALFLFVQPGIPSHEAVPPTFKVSLSWSVELPWEHPDRHTRGAS